MTPDPNTLVFEPHDQATALRRLAAECRCTLASRMTSGARIRAKNATYRAEVEQLLSKDVIGLEQVEMERERAKREEG